MSGYEGKRGNVPHPEECYTRVGWDDLYHALRGRERGRERGHNLSLPEIEMKHPNSGLGDIISHVNQAKHRAAMFLSI